MAKENRGNPRPVASLANLNPSNRSGKRLMKTVIQEAFVNALEQERKEGKEKVSNTYNALIQKAMTAALKDPSSRAGIFMLEKLIDPKVIESIDNSLNRNRKEDLDFQLYRIVKKAFPIQQHILNDLNKLIISMAGRRAGKTDVIKKKITSVLISKEDAKVIYIAKTISVGMQQIFEGVLDLLKEFSVEIVESNRTEGRIKLDNNAELFIRGNSSTEEREKLRGFLWDLAIIDEAQSQTALPYLINDIIEPALIDRKGQLFIAGTGPRVRGTYFEALWSETEKFRGSRYNWNLTDNIFIEDHENVLNQILIDKKLTKESPLFVREYLGKIAYDDDALVIRLSDHNFFTDADLTTWIRSQPRSDIKFTAGLDFGFRDANAFVIIMYSEKKDEKFIVYEYKMNQQGSVDLANAINLGIKYINESPLFYEIPEKFFYIYADSAAQQLIFDFYNQYKLPVQNAFKANKDLAYELLQDEARMGYIKTRKDSIFSDESLKTIWKRNDRDELTREVDDDQYHPDLIDAVLYSLRVVWMYGKKRDPDKQGKLFLDPTTGSYYEK